MDSGMTPIEHYVRIGQCIGRKPNGREERSWQQPEANGPATAARTAAPVWPPLPESDDTNPYKQYEADIFAKLDALSRREKLPIDVEIDTNYTGPAHLTPFDSFTSAREREISVRQTVKMLQLGIVAVNPRPGVHAAREKNGDFIRYPSIAAEGDMVEQVPPSMLIHIHAFYPDILEEMLGRFVGPAHQARFLITTTTQKNHEAVSRIVEEQAFSRARVIRTENNGRDVGPFLDHVIDHAGDGDVICHVHTKKSPDVGGSYGEKWRKSLYGTLLTQTAMDAFQDRNLGLLFPDFSRSVGWGKNRAFCEAMAEKLDMQLRAHPGPIPVGNMFIARVEVARMMRGATQGMQWPREPVPYDGSVLHAIERMWPLVCERAGLSWSAIHARSIS
ncbi:hypothetical protein JI59_25910 (plasmid) [Novosphingobium pentaromativorans US6-1]|nr:hypothetical protein JI59_25910 [Novosphingobium pentaromativorans US6-1]